MRNLHSKFTQTTLFFLLLCSSQIFSQEGKTSLSQNPKFEELLNEKRKVNSTLAINDGYKIQIFSGNSSDCKKQLNDFKKEYKELDGTIVFSSPQYKVYIGPFRSRLHAEGTLKRIKDKYPTSLLIKP